MFNDTVNGGIHLGRRGWLVRGYERKRERYSNLVLLYHQFVLVYVDTYTITICIFI